MTVARPIASAVFTGAPSLLDDFTEKAKLAGRSGRLVVSADGSADGLTVSVATEKFGDRVLRTLSHIPYLTHLFEAVRKFAEQERLDNRVALGIFIQAVSEHYSSEAATVSLEMMLSKVSAKGLNERTVKQVLGLARRYAGQGDAKPSARHVCVNIWPYRSIRHPGHTSVTISHLRERAKTHISWWPHEKRNISADTPANSTLKPAALDKLNEWFEPYFAVNQDSYEGDLKKEIGTADLKLAAGERARATIRNRIAEGSWIDKPALDTPEKIDSAIAELQKLRQMCQTGSRSPDLDKINAEANDLQLQIEATFKPRPAQIKSTSTGAWGTIAERVYLPLSGPQNPENSTGSAKRAFALFGLNERAMSEDARKVTENATAYGKIRKARNDKVSTKLRDRLATYQQRLQDLKEAVEASTKTLSGAVEALHLEKLSLQALQLSGARFDVLRLQEKQVRKFERQIANQDKLQASALVKVKALESKIHDVEFRLSPNAEAEEEAQALKLGTEIGYQFASKTNNCTGMVARMVRAGGADDFVPYKNVTDLLSKSVSPDEKFTNYVVALQKTLDQWNDRADAVQQRLQSALNDVNLDSFVNAASGQLTPASLAIVPANSPARRALVSARIALSENQIQPGDDSSAANKKMMRLVAACEDFFMAVDKLPTNHPQSLETLHLFHTAFVECRNFVSSTSALS